MSLPGGFEVPVWYLFVCGVAFGVGGFLLGYHAAVENRLLRLRREERRWIEDD